MKIDTASQQLQTSLKKNEDNAEEDDDYDDYADDVLAAATIGCSRQNTKHTDSQISISDVDFFCVETDRLRTETFC